MAAFVFPFFMSSLTAIVSFKVSVLNRNKVRKILYFEIMGLEMFKTQNYFNNRLSCSKYY